MHGMGRLWESNSNLGSHPFWKSVYLTCWASKCLEKACPSYLLTRTLSFFAIPMEVGHSHVGESCWAPSLTICAVKSHCHDWKTWFCCVQWMGEETYDFGDLRGRSPSTHADEFSRRFSSTILWFSSFSHARNSSISVAQWLRSQFFLIWKFGEVFFAPMLPINVFWV